MNTEIDVSDPDDTGDMNYVIVRNKAGLPDIKVWNLSGQPLRVKANRGEGPTNLRSSIRLSRPYVYGGEVQNRHLLHSFSYEPGVDWAIVSPQVAGLLRRVAENSRIIVVDDNPDGFPKRLDGKMAMELFLLGFRVWAITNQDELAALGELDFSSIGGSPAIDI